MGEGIDLTYLPAGITAVDYANMPPEHQFLVEQQMMQSQQQARMKKYASGLNEEGSDQLLFEKNDGDETDPLKK